jgi:hypothetical protein
LPRLNRFKNSSTEFYFERGQIVTLEGQLFQHQVRYRDSFGTDLIGHYLVDEHDQQVKMFDDSIPSFRRALGALMRNCKAKSL